MRIRPIYGVLERELVRMFRQRTRLVAAMVRPLIWLLVIGGGFALVLQYAGTARPCTTMLRRCRSRRLLL